MTANPTVTRRNFLLGAALCATMLSGCSQGDGDQAAAEDQPAAAPAAGDSVLVAYYSAQGHTAAVAQTIADELGADLFEVTPTEPYSDDDLDWTDDSSRVTREHEDESLRDVELTQVTPNGWENYDTVLVGYPIWWGIAAWPIDNFISGNDWDGKTVVPFCTSSSSGLGRSGELLAEAEVPVYMAIGENDDYYGSGPAREAYEEIRAAYRAHRLSEERISELVVLDVKPTSYFTERGFTADAGQHGAGGYLFAHDEDIMGWLFAFLGALLMRVVVRSARPIIR